MGKHLSPTVNDPRRIAPLFSAFNQFSCFLSFGQIKLGIYLILIGFGKMVKKFKKTNFLEGKNYEKFTKFMVMKRVLRNFPIAKKCAKSMLKKCAQ
jgi:hypothetical protein